MKYLILAALFASQVIAQAQDAAPAQPPAPPQGPIITWADANDQDYYGYNGYYYGGGYYGYGGGYAGRGRDWNNYSDGRYEDRQPPRGGSRPRRGRSWGWASLVGRFGHAKLCRENRLEF